MMKRLMSTLISSMSMEKVSLLKINKVSLINTSIFVGTGTMKIKHQEKASFLFFGDFLILLTLGLRLKRSLIVHMDTSSFVGLKNNQYLTKQGISIDVGNSKNINKNRVAEKAIREL